MLNKRYCVVGIGYIGLSCAIMLANAGCKVLGVDINKDVVNGVNSGDISIEDELNRLLLSETVRNNLVASVNIDVSDVYIVAVPTPICERKKVAELSALVNAVRSVASVLKQGDIVIVESTIPPFTIKNIVMPILEESGLLATKDFYLSHCPERLLPGNIVHEIINNNRIIGGVTVESAEKAAEVYRLFVKAPINITDDVTAELCKLIENAYRDINIAFSNELSEVCSDIGVNVNEVIDLANLHPRVNLLKPGIGVGGHCLPIDPWFIHEVSPYNSTMIMTARHINDGRPAKIAAKIRTEISSDMTQEILILGKTYKPETNDTRESPAIKIINSLTEDGYRVLSYDPIVDTSISLKDIAHKVKYIFVLVPHNQIIFELNELLSNYKNEGKNIPKVIYF